ncbi:MAG: tRNA (adenosine(37)-N6)-dimethylallyltransferase MiaA [Sphingobacteriaceae bacterium]|nr:tRNA (adenosine(37)-N6)-dimethylallyltransferase MiaA [Sphingobacteriaceae bacterium]
MRPYNCIVVLGPTASGKTKLACEIAYQCNGEIISADSRQVYRNLDIGTGKDLNEYSIHNKNIKYHLIDIQDPSEQYYLHQFIAGCDNAFYEIIKKNKTPVICGGTGLYLDSLHKDYSYTQIRENEELRKQLNKLSKNELTVRLNKYPDDTLRHVDRNSIKRLIRAIEIGEYVLAHGWDLTGNARPYKPLYIGLELPLARRKLNIEYRLEQRLKSGLIEEVEMLLKRGITHQRLQFLGLEYKWVSLYLEKKISLSEMQTSLLTGILQYAKRQMTWFRKMEKEGIKINWINPVNFTEALDLIHLSFRK